MPPVRRLALDLGVHFNTVAEAYRTLAEEGWLEIGRRTGARAVPRATPNRVDPQSGEAFQHGLKELMAEQQSHGVTRGRIARELRRLADTLERT
jgi:GntR family transcriptional regulator